MHFFGNIWQQLFCKIFATILQLFCNILQQFCNFFATFCNCLPFATFCNISQYFARFLQLFLHLNHSKVIKNLSVLQVRRWILREQEASWWSFVHEPTHPPSRWILGGLIWNLDDLIWRSYSQKRPRGSYFSNLLIQFHIVRC